MTFFSEQFSYYFVPKYTIVEFKGNIWIYNGTLPLIAAEVKSVEKLKTETNRFTTFPNIFLPVSDEYTLI